MSEHYKISRVETMHAREAATNQRCRNELHDTASIKSKAHGYRYTARQVKEVTRIAINVPADPDPSWVTPLQPGDTHSVGSVRGPEAGNLLPIAAPRI